MTVGDATIVIGPAGANRLSHRALATRVIAWRPTTPAPPAAPGAAGGVRAAMQQCADSAPGTAALVHRATGEVTYLSSLGSGVTRWTGIRTLREVSGHPLGDGGDGDLRPLHDPWIGPLKEAVVAPSPRGLAVARCRARALSPGGDGVGWAPDPSDASRLALMAGLRTLSSGGFPGHGARGSEYVGAAGRSELHWLLDGALALISRYARGLGPVLASGPIGSSTGPTVTVLHAVPDLPGTWRFAEVISAESAARLAAAWGRDAAQAVDQATIALWAAGPGGPPAVHPSAEPMLSRLPARDLTRLSRDLAVFSSRVRMQPTGVRVAADALLGAQKVAWGPVWLN